MVWTYTVEFPTAPSLHTANQLPKQLVWLIKKLAIEIGSVFLHESQLHFGKWLN